MLEMYRKSDKDKAEGLQKLANIKEARRRYALETEQKEKSDAEKMPPPPAIPPKSVPRQSESKPPSPAKGLEAGQADIPFGQRYKQAMKDMPKEEGESRRAYRARLMASMRALEKGKELPKPLEPKKMPKPRSRGKGKGKGKEKLTPKPPDHPPPTRTVRIREPSCKPGRFAKKMVLKSRAEAEDRRKEKFRRGIWGLLDEKDADE